MVCCSFFKSLHSPLLLQLKLLIAVHLLLLHSIHTMKVQSLHPSASIHSQSVSQTTTRTIIIIISSKQDQVPPGRKSATWPRVRLRGTAAALAHYECFDFSGLPVCLPFSARPTTSDATGRRSARLPRDGCTNGCR